MRIRRILAAVLVFAAAALSAVAATQHPEDIFVGQEAPELKPQTDWINSTPLKLESLRGKVVMIDFWAYDCPNCAEAMPHVKALHDKYAKDGLVIIGVHTPRIDYEKDIPKVRAAVQSKGIQYPVVIDNHSEIWMDYVCNVWPSHMVIDPKGVIQLSHSGTGRYEDTEAVIRKLLGKEAAKPDSKPESKVEPKSTVEKEKR